MQMILMKSGILEMSECLTVFTKGRLRTMVVRRFYDEPREALKIAKRCFKKTRCKTWIEKDDGTITKIFGR